ncbi:hypothetical protein [Bacillus licheniformis]|nr:hypothetical protein [Bacillus licheniformis]MCY7775401.1 hypothetical protein [Bacillus licheniformis]
MKLSPFVSQNAALPDSGIEKDSSSPNIKAAKDIFRNTFFIQLTLLFL